MDGPSFLEEPLFGTIDTQLTDAVDELPDISKDDLDSITRQKLRLDVVEGLGATEYVTTQYYLHGKVAPKGKENNRSGNVDLHLPSTVDSDLPSDEAIFTYLTDERSDYVTEAVNTDTFEWLEGHYESADEYHFRDVYLAALPIYRDLYRLRAATIERNPNFVPADLEQTVLDQSLELKRALNRYSMFRDIPPYVTEFKNSVLPAVRWVDSADLNEQEILEYYDFTDRLYKLFYDGVWKACGQQMSYTTVEGPSAEDTIDRRKREIDQQKTTFELMFDRLEMETDDFEFDLSVNTDRLPELEPIDADPEPELAEELDTVARDDPAFDVLAKNNE
ncbi:hypothetical protein SAMN05216388_101121 [Halorientalis persicus]|uniref:DUF8098 domain-containing protein n=1 Tax=Halorientalis persicus TaxID=1367881 RepID=A0A1H8NR68_9EURY|nr:hypothetical protein [Halorientalis persicus]SEO32106.1 hypothetical protein SAMN05216388_101121 [Halorientalis persicus]